MQIVHTDNRLITADCDSGKRQTRPLVRESAVLQQTRKSGSNKDLVLSLRCVHCSKTDLPSDRWP
jgi:hypothetical protein